jgi:hypothetical protein
MLATAVTTVQTSRREMRRRIRRRVMLRRLRRELAAGGADAPAVLRRAPQDQQAGDHQVGRS